MELKGCVGILTGASRGIGVHIARELAQAGVRLALAARDRAGLEATAALVRDHGGEAVVVPTDVARLGDLENLVGQAEERLGPVDLLINNAGIERYADYTEVALEDIETIIEVNLLAPMRLTRLVVPGMVARGRGHVVNLASVAGKTAMPYNTTYSASKHGLVGFSWSLREELRPRGVGVSVVCPAGVSEVGMWASWEEEGREPLTVRTVSPQRVARAVVRAVERNRAEVIVGNALLRSVDVLHALSPELTTRVARLSGAYDLFRSRWERQSRRQAT